MRVDKTPDGYRVISAGPDAEFGTRDDIVFPKRDDLRGFTGGNIKPALIHK